MINKLKNQQGAALVLVLALVIIAGILGFAAMSVAENQTIMVNRHQQREKALHFAEAGIHRYLAEINDDLDFYATPASTAMQNVDTAFKDGYYKLQVIQPSPSNPYVTIRSTGWPKNSDIKRTVEAKLYKKSMLCNIITANMNEDKIDYFHRFLRGDVINGPLHINGKLITNGRTGEGTIGPIFMDKVTYSDEWIAQPDPRTVPTDTTQFKKGVPVKVPPMAMPQNTDIPTLKSKAEASGYVYEGRTCIYITRSTLKIRNKTSAVQEKPLPPNGIIYVKGTLGDKWALGTPNVFVSGVLEGRLTIVAEANIYITAFDMTSLDRPKGSLTYPMAKSGSGGVTYYGLDMSGVDSKEKLASKLSTCNDMLGLIASKDVQILHNNWPKGIPDSPAYYWNSWGWSGLGAGGYSDVSPENMNIHAAICAVTGSFRYEDPLKDLKNKLTVVGSISQSTIGAVGGFGNNIFDFNPPFEFLDVFKDRLSGYGKNYWHDPRLMYDAPPDFLEPSNAGWEIIEWREISNP